MHYRGESSLQASFSLDKACRLDLSGKEEHLPAGWQSAGHYQNPYKYNFRDIFCVSPFLFQSFKATFDAISVHEMFSSALVKIHSCFSFAT